MDLSQHAQGAVTPVQHVQTRDKVICARLIVPTFHANNTEGVHRVNIMRCVSVNKYSTDQDKYSTIQVIIEWPRAFRSLP